jgi:predicted metalloprotease with PDZ domain
MNPGDLISAIDGRRVLPGAWDKLLEQCRPGQTIRITYFRSDSMRETEATLTAQPATPLRIVRDPGATDAQRAEYQRWLGVEWPAAKPEPSSEQ